MKILRDKRGFKFKNALFSLVVMSMMIFAIGYWVDDWNTKYDSGLTYDLGQYEKLDEVSGFAQTSKEEISVRGNVDTGSGDFEGTSLRGVFAVMNNIFTPFTVVLGEGGLLSSIQNRWGIPNYIVIGLATLMVIAIIMTIAALFFRRVEDTT